MMTMIPSLTVSNFLACAKETPKTLDESDFWASGREALYAAVTSLPKRGTILVPASLCGEVLHPLFFAGYKVRYYALDNALRYSIQDIERELSEDVCGVYVVHYYGFKQAISDISAFCADRGLFLIDDCAHCFWDGQDALDVSSLPDGFTLFRLYSLWKFFAIPDGSLLEGFGPVTSMKKGRRLPPPSPWRWLLKSGLRRFSVRTSAPFDDDEKFVAAPIQASRGMSSVAHWLLARQQFMAIGSRRRENYRLLLEAFQNCPWGSPLYQELPEGIIPYQFPVVTNSAALHARALAHDGVVSEISLSRPYSEAPNVLPSGGNLSNIAKMNKLILSLPVHQHITANEIDKICERIKRPV